MASKIANPIIRRVEGSTPLYEIVELSILPAEGDQPEMLEISARNKRQDPVLGSYPLAEALALLFPSFWGEGDSVQNTKTPTGVVEVKSLEDAIMIEGEFTNSERARFFNLVRDVQRGEK